MIAPTTTFGRLHGQLVSSSYGLDSIDRGRLTRIRTKAGPLTYRDASWIQRKVIEMETRIDDETAVLIFNARTELLNCKTREDAVKVDYSEAKNATSTAQFRLNKLIDEARDPSLFAKPQD